MKGLNCTTTNCEFNRNGKCTAISVEISNRGICNTKMKRDGGMLSQMFESFETAGELEDIANPKDVVVRCDANCLYNVNRICGRENINVEDSLISTKCFSRKKPL